MTHFSSVFTRVDDNCFVSHLKKSNKPAGLQSWMIAGKERNA